MTAKTQGPGHQMHAAHVYAGLKAATRQLTRAAGGRDAAAMVTRLDGPRISRCGLAHETMFLPIDVVADLEADTGVPVVTRALAAANGHLLVAMPQVDGDAKWARELGAMAKEAGEAMAALGEAFSNDGRITADEVGALHLREQVREAMEVMARVDAALEAIQNGEGE